MRVVSPPSASVACEMSQLKIEKGTYGALYAKYYDLLYSDKDYGAECDYVERLFERFGAFPVHSILDISCGTGGHAIPLASRGYDVAALDYSKHMVDVARRKARRSALKMEFKVGDMCSFSFDREFDACITMFDSVDALDSYSDVDATVKSVATHLRPGSLFLVQFWNAAAVLTVRPAPRQKTIERNGVRILRLTEPVLEPVNHVCDVRYEVMVIRGKRIIEDFVEEERVRAFSPDAMRFVMNSNGFEVCGVYPFLSLDAQVSANDWSVVMIGKMKKSPA